MQPLLDVAIRSLRANERAGEGSRSAASAADSALTAAGVVPVILLDATLKLELIA
jgi:hypothetical protein